MIIDEKLTTENTKLTDNDIFKQIWLSPRKVFKYLNDFKDDNLVTILLVLAGITRAFDRASTKNMGDDIPLLGVIGICLIGGALLGWVSYYIYAALLSWTGRWLKGQGNTDSLIRMIAHAMIPSIVSLVLLIPKISLFGNGVFQSDLDLYGSGLVYIVIFYICFILEAILAIWTIVLFIIGLSEVQKISIGKSILNMFLPILIILIPIALIAFIFGDLFG